MCHVEQPIQHGRPRYLVESAQPVHEDCSFGILFAEVLEHMNNALTPSSRGKRVLMRSGGPLDDFRDLLRNRSRNESSDHVLQQSLAHSHLASAMPSCAQLELPQPQLEERWPVTARTSGRKNAEIEDSPRVGGGAPLSCLDLLLLLFWRNGDSSRVCPQPDRMEVLLRRLRALAASSLLCSLIPSNCNHSPLAKRSNKCANFSLEIKPPLAGRWSILGSSMNNFPPALGNRFI